MRTEARRERVLATATGRPEAAGVVTNALSPAGAAPGLETVSTNPSLRLAVVVAIAIAGLSWDLWTKQEVFRQLGHPGFHPIWKGQLLGVSIRFQLETAFNHGALWGIGQGRTWLFAALSFVAITAIGYFLWNRQAISSRWLTTVTGLLLAGTLGNLYDRLGLHGWTDERGKAVYAVRDFLDFYFFNDSFHWATFNFADTYLVVGAAMLVVHSFWSQPDAGKPDRTV
ncbi:MAG: signal peptidase II [Planctomycetes bacterium]|nr:signal peptidase II [Planctomycetota bacterium]